MLFVTRRPIKLVRVWSYFQSGDNIPFGEFPEHQAEVGIHQVVYLLRAVDSGDVAQLRRDRRVEAHKPRDDTTLPGQHLSCPAATGRLADGERSMGIMLEKSSINTTYSNSGSNVRETEE